MASSRVFLAYPVADFIPRVQRTPSIPSVNMDFSPPVWRHAAASRVAIRGRAEGLIPFDNLYAP